LLFCLVGSSNFYFEGKLKRQQKNTCFRKRQTEKKQKKMKLKNCKNIFKEDSVKIETSAV
jgi:hypothetical protein